MSSERDTYKYYLKQGEKIVYRGITSDLERREVEHQERFPDSRIYQVGRKTIRKAALRWQQQERRRYLNSVERTTHL